MGYKSFFIILIILLFQAVFFADAQTIISGDNINVSMDYARYRYESEETYLEIYYSAAGVRKDEQTPLPPVRLLFQLESAETGKLLADREVTLDLNEGVVAASAAGSKKLGLIQSVLPTGKYRLRMFRLDPVSGQKQDSLEYDFATAPFSGEKVTMSDLELASNIILHSPRKDATFYKNTMEVIPQPSRIFGGTTPRLYYYIELYNTQDLASDSQLQIQVVIADKEGKIRAKKNYLRPKRYASLVEKGAFNVGKFESGLYTLIFAVTDSSKNYSVYRRANFVVNNPQITVVKQEDEELKFLQSQFYNMPEDVVDRMFDQASYIATREEQTIYKSLTNPESKRKFLFQFWNRRNQENPDFQFEYYQRIEYANEHFRAPGKEGWETDRGRVYVLYGPPDHIERNPYESGQNPYQLWFYESIEGGVEFDFVDLTGHGDFQLLNSTKRDEIQDPNWQQYLTK